jgi:hypothetical protein
MALTKPAGVAIQIIGGTVLIGGVGLLNTSILLGIVFILIGVLIMLWGRTPATRK